MIAFFAVAVGMWGGERIKGRQLNPAFVTPLLVLHPLIFSYIIQLGIIPYLHQAIPCWMN